MIGSRFYSKRKYKKYFGKINFEKILIYFIGRVVCLVNIEI